VRAIADGQHAALDELYARYGRIVFSLARRIVVDSGLAEDVAQEVFFALWRDPGKYDPDRGAFGTWLLSLTHHRAVDAVRREEAVRRRRTRAREEGESLALTDAPPAVADEALVGVRRDQVRQALRGLPSPQREALTLAYFGGYTQREVAAITGTPLGTVKTRMLAGMRRLRDALAADDGTAGDLL
jgi:RNA polymerase sigma-70 factor (ECF subfamily)